MADKQYSPETISDNPFPESSDTPTSEGGGVSNAESKDGQQLSPQTNVQKKFPVKKIANETIGSSLNTLSKRILGIFDFGPLGAIQIGKQENGVSGDVKISPNGIVARNQSGDTTFALDGETGDATFRGTVQASGFTLADENGLRSVGNFQFFQAGKYDSTSTTTTSTSPVDVTDLTIPTFTLSRPTFVFIYLTVQAYISAGLNGAQFNVVDVEEYGSVEVSIIFSAGVSSAQTFATNNLFLLGAGPHTIKAQWKVLGGATTATAINRQISCILFGN